MDLIQLLNVPETGISLVGKMVRVTGRPGGTKSGHNFALDDILRIYRVRAARLRADEMVYFAREDGSDDPGEERHCMYREEFEVI